MELVVTQFELLTKCLGAMSQQVPELLETVKDQGQLSIYSISIGKWYDATVDLLITLDSLTDDNTTVNVIKAFDLIPDIDELVKQ